MSSRKQGILLLCFLVCSIFFAFVISDDNKPTTTTNLEIVNTDGSTDMISSYHSANGNSSLSKEILETQIFVETLLKEKEYINDANLSLSPSENDDSNICFSLTLDGFKIIENLEEILLILSSNIKDIDLENGCIFDTEGNLIY